MLTTYICLTMEEQSEFAFWSASQNFGFCGYRVILEVRNDLERHQASHNCSEKRQLTQIGLIFYTTELIVVL